MPAQCTTLVCVVDATDPAPAAELPAAVELIADHGHLVLAVLHPPPGLTLNARLIAWQQVRREQVTAAALAPALSRLPSSGLAERGVRIHTTAWHHRRGPGGRHRRVAAALLRLCRVHDADVLVGYVRGGGVRVRRW
ncbi:hypothetical protein BG618_01885 [Pseudonocardia autotrophica]|nr:hypothetical protein BG618_01885 [Pseudonocardia autotrophica]